MPDRMRDLFTGDAGGMQPVNVWLGYAAPISLGWFTKSSLVAFTLELILEGKTYAEVLDA
jgi:hypothetical protein